MSDAKLTGWQPRVENYGDGAVLTCLYRDKRVVATPEERVRQQVLRWLLRVVKWPRELIAVEFTQRLTSGRRRRPDILLLNEEREPYVIIECKNQEIYLGEEVLNQAVGYANKEGCKQIWLTNGENNLFYRRDDDGWRAANQLDELHQIEANVPHSPTRMPNFNDRRSIAKYWKRQAGLEHLARKDYSEVCDFALAVHKVIYDMSPEPKLPYSYKGVHLLEDRGVRPLRFSTPAGSWWGFYRNFLVATEGRVEAAAIGLQPWQTSTVDDVILCVGFIKETRRHHALQLHFKNCDKVQRGWNIWHDATMGGRPIPARTVVDAIVEAGQTHLLGPQMDWEKIKWQRRIRLGKLRNPATANWRNTRDFVANLLHYGIIRTNLREASSSR